jgi:hypothetical protein
LRDRDHGTLELVATAPSAQRRLLWARATAGVGLAWLAVAPGLLHESFVHPAMCAAACVIAASIVLWGLAAATLAGHSRPFELAFIAAAYATTQGLPWLDAAARGNGVALAHLAGLGLAAAVLTMSLRADRQGRPRTP